MTTQEFEPELEREINAKNQPFSATVLLKLIAPTNNIGYEVAEIAVKDHCRITWCLSRRAQGECSTI